MNSKKLAFPVVPVDEIPLRPTGSETEPNRPVILVVDDEMLIADSLTEILKRNGYAAIPAYDGEAALETALVMPPEMLISDVVLPGMSGIELAVTIKRVFPDCKIILSSGQSSTTHLLASADSDVKQFVFLQKPVHPKILLDHVSNSLQAESLADAPAAPLG